MNGYELLEPFQNKDAGFSRWTYARKNGKCYFLKEFLDPVYPFSEQLSEELKKSRVEVCKEYENRKKNLYQAINSAGDGNLIRVTDFFRSDSHYYISTPQVESEKVSFQDISRRSLKEKLILCRTAAHAVMKLHEKHIVHADIKGSNVLIKKTKTGNLAAKLIDFDCSFFENEPPSEEDELGGDQVYLAPEACLFLCGEPVRLSCKIDVFALGLLFHQYFTGELPEFNHEEYDYAYEAVLDEAELEISEEIPYEYRVLIQRMLEREPEKRADMNIVFHALHVKPEQNIRPDNSFYCAGDL